jgi:hypothetical protein
VAQALTSPWCSEAIQALGVSLAMLDNSLPENKNLPATVLFHATLSEFVPLRPTKVAQVGDVFQAIVSREVFPGEYEVSKQLAYNFLLALRLAEWEFISLASSDTFLYALLSNAFHEELLLYHDGHTLLVAGSHRNGG